MKNIFSNARHTVTEANINYYSTQFVHPKRTIGQHDFIYLLDGEWKIGQNGEEYELKKDSILILGANQQHYGVSPCREGTKTMYFHLSCEDGDRMSEVADSEQETFAVDTLIGASNNRNIKKFFFETVNAKLSGDDRRSSVYFDLLLCELCRNEPRHDSDKIAELIRNKIHQSPERFFSNFELAESVGVSLKTAENKFKAHFGLTIHQYTLQFKIELAKSYIQGFPQMQIKEIAYNLGFYDEYHFSKQFKRLTGVSPSEFKH